MEMKYLLIYYDCGKTINIKCPVVNKLSYSIFRKKIMHGTLNKNLNLKIKPGLVYLKPNLFILT